MLKPIDNLPTGAVGFVAHGRVTDGDRETILEPTLAWALEANGRVRLLYVAAEDFDGYDGGRAYDEAVFGSRHFADFERIAFVAGEGPYARSVAALEGLMPGSIKVFAPADLSHAKMWIAG